MFNAQIKNSKILYMTIYSYIIIYNIYVYTFKKYVSIKSNNINIIYFNTISFELHDLFI